jgi:hypothetical protein
MVIQVKVTKTAAVAAIVKTMVELELTLNTMILPRRLTSSIEMLELPLLRRCEKLVNSWVVMPSLNNCVVNF